MSTFQLNAFESVVAMVLRHDGYWVTPSVKVQLTKKDKVRIGRPSSPRWEIDLIAFKPFENLLLVVECKSYLDSPGVLFRKGEFHHPQRYKLFTDDVLREVVMLRLKEQLVAAGTCLPSTCMQLCLAVGNMCTRTDAVELQDHFLNMGWTLLLPGWIQERLKMASEAGYENDVAFVVSKLLLRK